MGDMADFAIDSMIFDMTEEDAWIGMNVRCKYCNRNGFIWDQTEKGCWRLTTHSGKVHRCSDYQRAKKGESK